MKSLQTSFTRSNPTTKIKKNRICRSPRDAGEPPENQGQHDSQTEQENQN